MEPDGILNAWTIKARINSARTTAIRMASAYSLKIFFLGAGSSGDEFCVLVNVFPFYHVSNVGVLECWSVVKVAGMPG